MIDNFVVDIKQIYSERPGIRGVFVEAETDCYGKRKESLYFLNNSWKRIKQLMKYNEAEAKDKRYGEYLESLSDSEYYKRFEHDIQKFTDEELVAEINRRAAEPGIFCKIGFEVKVILKNGAGTPTKNF